MADESTGTPRPARPGAEDLLGVLAEEAAAAPRVHPSDDALLAYRDGELEPEAEDRLRDHLVGCRECTERLLDLEALRPGSEDDRAAGSEVEAAADWRGLRAALAGEAAPDASRRVGATGDRSRSRAPWALAAVLALAVLGLGSWVAELRRDVERLAAPQANLPILYLDEPVRAADAEGPRIAAAAAEGRVLLIVTPPLDGGAARYRAVVALDGGREVWRGGGLVPSESGTLRLLLPPGSLAPGEYELRLGDAAEDPSRSLARYRFTVVPEAHGTAP